MKYPICLTLALLMPLSAFAQITAVATCRCKESWPPKTADIINVNAAQHPSADSFDRVTIPPGISHVVYTVPSNKYFVFTSWNDTPTTLRLDEDLLGSLTTKLNTGFYDRNNYKALGVGVAFSPGSNVILTNTQATPQQTGYVISGYLVSPGTTGTWPPAPENLVAVSTGNEPGAGSYGEIILAPSELYPLYVVPSNKRLVVTYAYLGSMNIDLHQDLAGVVTTMIPAGIAGHNFDEVGVGIVFAPGSTVAIKNLLPTPSTPLTTTIIGYLTP